MGAAERERLAARAALSELGGLVLLLDGAPRLITRRSTARACLAALKLPAEAAPLAILACVAERADAGPAAVDALADRGAWFDANIDTPRGRIAVAGRSAGLLSWLRLTLAAPAARSPPSRRPAVGLADETALLEATADAVALFDADQRLTWHNTAFAALWDLDPAWLANRPSHGEWLDRLRRRRRLPEAGDYAAFRAGELARHRQPTPSPPALWRLPDERLLKLADQPLARGGLALVFSDITRETALVSRTNHLAQVHRAVLDGLAEAVAVFGGDGRLAMHNRAFVEFFGLTAAEIAEQPDFDGVTARCVAVLHDLAFWRDLKGRITDADPGVRLAGGGELRLSDGRWASWTSRPLPDGATLIGFANSTAARRLAEALADKEAALAEAERMRGAFVASVGYEMRIPLTTVLGYCDLIERAGRLADPRDRAWLASARAAAGQLAASIEDVLTLAELDAGELALERQALALDELLAAAAEARSPAAREAGVTLEVAPVAGVGGVTIEADAVRLRQALDHLIANGLRHTPRGGRVRLSAELAENEARIAVADNGRGIPFDVQARAFDRFAAGGPVGLGLPLVKALIELHGGWVSLESEPELGATFTCHLPRSGGETLADLFVDPA